MGALNPLAMKLLYLRSITLKGLRLHIDIKLYTWIYPVAKLPQNPVIFAIENCKV